MTIIPAQNLIDRTVSLEVTDQPVDSVINALSRYLSTQFSKQGDLYFLGELRQEDLGVMVRRVTRLDKSEIESSVKSVVTSSGKVFTTDDGLLVVTDQVQVLQRVDSVLDGIEQSESVSWVVQLYVISVSDKDIRDLGIDVTPAASIAYSLAAATSGSSVSLGKVEASFNTVMRANDSRASNRLMAEPMFLLVDGSEATFTRGDTVPVPKQTVSDQGTVSVSGYDKIEAGVSINVKIREYSQDLVKIGVNLKLNEIVELVNGVVPRLSGEEYECSSLLRSGRIGLIGSLERRREKQSQSQWLNWGQSDEKETTTIQIWARAYRVDLSPESEKISLPAAEFSQQEQQGIKEVLANAGVSLF